MELARIFSSADVQTDRSIRFALWNNEEGGLAGSTAYVKQRASLQGKEDPPGSGKYPEPTWLGMIQHDMMLWDHGMPGPDGKVNPKQRAEADVNIEFQATSKLVDKAMTLAFTAREANERYATDYPAAVGNHMTNTDSTPFMDLTPSISLRENERGMQTGAGWNPNYHQPSDLFVNYTDDDFRLGLNAAQTTLGTVGLLALMIISDYAPWINLFVYSLPVAGIVWFGLVRRDDDSRRIAAILVFFVCAILFWAVFEQAGSSLTLFADELTRNELLGFAFPSSWFQSVNSLFILILAPLFAWLWVRLRERQPSMPMKFVWGLVFLGLSFALLVPAAKFTAEGKVGPGWLIAVYFLQTIGELCLSPVGLSAMTKLAPAKLTGLVMGVWFLGTALGNKLAGVVAAEFNGKDPQALAHFFWQQALLVAGMAVLLLVLTPWVRRLTGEAAR